MSKTRPFDEQAEEYDAWFAVNRDIYQAELDALRGILPKGRGVEIGVGTGRFADPLGIGIGVEPAMPMARMAKQRGIEVVAAVAEALPFADGVFDFALMVTVDCFLDDAAQAFREAGRILNHQGAMIVGFINPESALGRRYNERKQQSRFFADAVFHSAGELEALLTGAGFSGFTYRRTLLPGKTIGLTVHQGRDEGGFVAVRAVRQGNEARP